MDNTYSIVWKELAMVPQPAQATWQRKTLQLADGDLEYVDTGGTGEAVVLLHGVLMDELLWAPVVERLVPRWRCLVPTLPLGAHRIPRPAHADQGPHGANREGQHGKGGTEHSADHLAQ